MTIVTDFVGSLNHYLARTNEGSSALAQCIDEFGIVVDDPGSDDSDEDA